MFQATQSNYQVIECDLETCKLITTHTFIPINDKGSKLIESFDYVSGEKEGYQILFGRNDRDLIENYKSFLSDKYDSEVVESGDIVHVAFDNKDHLVKIDLRVPVTKIENLKVISINLEKIFQVKNLLKGFSKYCRGFNGTVGNVHVQLYINGSTSIEFVNISDATKFFDACRQNQLLNDNQIQFVRTESGGRIFSIKFKWVDNILQRKMYHRVNK